MSALIGALRVSLSADTKQFETGMKRAQASAAQASGGINKSLGAMKVGLAGLVSGLSIGAITRAIDSSLQYAASLGELAATLGLTTRDLQTFRFAAGQVGISQDELENGIQKLTISMGKAQLGAKAQADAFKAIGISIDEIKGKDTGQVFRMIAEKLEAVSDRSKRAAVEVALFGKAGAKLDNLLSGMQGGLSELSDAAERLGIVLSDEQIQKADETADKLDAMKTVLQARVAGVVADNADAILKLADALSTLAGTAVQVFGPLSQVFSLIAQTGALAVGPGLFGLFTGGGGGSSTQTLKLPPAHAPGKPVGSVGNFLASGGGGKKHKSGAADHGAEDSLRDQFQFDQQLRQAQMDVLRAQQDLAADYVARTSIGIDILNAEKASRDAEHQYQTALFKLTKGKQGQSEAQTRQLQAQEDITDSLERQKLLEDEQAQRAEDVQSLTQSDFDRRKDALQSQLSIAETADERRKIELELLQIAYDARRQALQNIIDTSKDSKEIENARRDLVNLKSTFGNDRQGVINSTRGPLEDFLASLPGTAAKVNEALQSIEVNGLDSLTDALTNVLMGTESLKDAFHNLAASVLADLIKMTIKMLLFRALTAAFGGSSSAGVSASASAIGNSGFATGGFTGMGSTRRIAGFVHGQEGVLNASAMRRLGVPTLNALNRGVPLSAVSNDNSSMGGRSSVSLTFHNDFRGADSTAVAGITARLDRMQAELPAKIVGTVKDAQSRFIIRK